MLTFLLIESRRRRARREVIRAAGGWYGSTLHGYLLHGDEQTYKLNFRMTRASVEHISTVLSAAGYLCDSKCRNQKLQTTSLFKVGVCLYYMAHSKGAVKTAADCASLGESTVRAYVREFCEGTFEILKPMYMPSKPPAAAVVQRWRSEFAARRGISNVAMAVDGSHVPFAGNAECRNYKGWTSILVVAFVTPFYTFVDADVGAPGRAGDNTVLEQSWLMRQIRDDPDKWLGVDGVVAADSGASDGGFRLLNPIPNAIHVEDVYCNFCHSSTRFPVEEIFGRWKNRFRFLLYKCDLDESSFVQLVYASLILHNLCTIRKDDAVEFNAGADEEWQEFFDTYARTACPSCVRRGVLHCSHDTRNRASSAFKAGNMSDLRDKIKARLFRDLEEDNEKGNVLQEMRKRASKRE